MSYYNNTIGANSSSRLIPSTFPLLCVYGLIGLIVISAFTVGHLTLATLTDDGVSSSYFKYLTVQLSLNIFYLIGLLLVLLTKSKLTLKLLVIWNFIGLIYVVYVLLLYNKTTLDAFPEIIVMLLANTGDHSTIRTAILALYFIIFNGSLEDKIPQFLLYFKENDIIRSGLLFSIFEYVATITFLGFIWQVVSKAEKKEL